MRWLVTGGAGFIGSHFLRVALRERAGVEIVNLDLLTYAGNLENIADLESNPRCRFVKGDIGDATLAGDLVRGCDAVLNFAAESHVDRSLYDPASFIRTNILGTQVLLEAARAAGVRRFLQVSTDEVYGPILEGAAREDSPLRPSSAYSAAKTGADLLALSMRGLDVVVTRSTNNYGPNQHPEKFIPLFVSNALEGRECPLYGDGMQERDWLYVEDNARGILAVLERGRPGEVYNIGAGENRPNREVAERILALVGNPKARVVPTGDRPGHDRRYAVDTAKVGALGWRPTTPFAEGLAATVAWYRANGAWTSRVKSGAYREYYDRHYSSLNRS